MTAPSSSSHVSAPAGATTREHGSDRPNGVGVAALLLCAFLPIVDFFIVNVAAPSIALSLHPSAPMLELVIAGYGTVYAAMLVVAGRAGDMVGRLRLLRIGIVGFTLTSALCAVAPSITVLVMARVLQAASASLMSPQVLATIQTSLSGQRRTRALGLFGAVAGSAAVVGQVGGGLLVDADIAGSGWRSIFMINVPLGVLLFLVLRRLVPETRSDDPPRIDILGTLLLGSTLICLLVPLTEGRTAHWAGWIWAVLALAVVLAVSTGIVERRVEARGGQPLLPPSLVRLRSMRIGLGLGVLYFSTFGAFMFVFALTMQNGLKLGALRGGLAIVPFAVPFLFGSVLASRAIERWGRAPFALGAALQVVGMSVLGVSVATSWPDVGTGQLAPGLAIAGFGEAFVYGSLFRLVLSEVPPRLAGIGGGVLITMQQSSLALGVAVFGTLFLGIAGTSTAHTGVAFGVICAAGAAAGAVLAICAPLLPSGTLEG